MARTHHALSAELRRSRLLALLPERLIEAVEHFRAARDPLQVIRRGQRDAVDQGPHADRFVAAELVVLEVNVVNDLGDGAQRRILGRDAIEQHLEGALVALMCELGLEHVEAQLAFDRAIALAGNELEARIRVDETTDQPRAPDTVNVYTLPRHPCSIAQRRKRAGLRIDVLVPHPGHILAQPNLQFRERAFGAFAANRTKEVDLDNLGEPLA